MAAQPDPIDIVPAGPGHAAEMAALHGASFAASWDEAAMARLIAAPASRVLIACEGYQHVPLGFVLAFLAADEAEILTLAVKPDRRRQGVGRRLVAALIGALEREGAQRLFLEVARSNAPARELYRRLAFAEAGVRSGYYRGAGGTAEDALVLERRLVPEREDGRPPASSL